MREWSGTFTPPVEIVHLQAQSQFRSLLFSCAGVQTVQYVHNYKGNLSECLRRYQGRNVDILAYAGSDCLVKRWCQNAHGWLLGSLETRRFNYAPTAVEQPPSLWIKSESAYKTLTGEEAYERGAT